MTCGDTQISSGDLRSVIAMMKNTDPNTGKTLLQAQFEVLSFQLYLVTNVSYLLQVLNQVTPDPNDKGTKYNSALQNKVKNRSMSFLPSEASAAILHLSSICNNLNR